MDSGLRFWGLGFTEFRPKSRSSVAPGQSTLFSLCKFSMEPDTELLTTSGFFQRAPFQAPSLLGGN